MKVTKVRPLVPVMVEFSDDHDQPVKVLVHVDYGRNKVYDAQGNLLPEDFFSLAILGKLDTPVPVTVLPKEIQEEISKKYTAKEFGPEFTSFQEA